MIQNRERLRAGPLAAALLLTLLPATVQAQMGAIHGLSGGTDAVASAPILSESAFMLGRGQVGGGGMYAFTGGSLPETEQNYAVDFSYGQVLLSGFYAPTDRLTLGLQYQPYMHVGVKVSAVGFDTTTHGSGDVAGYVKGELWRSAKGSTHLAAFGTVWVPAGSGDYNFNGAVMDAGLAVSQAVDKLTLHASADAWLPTKSEDGKSRFTVAGAAVFAAAPRVGLSGEVLGHVSDGNWMIEAAPGARAQLMPSLYVNGAVLVSVASSYDIKPYNYSLALGIQFVH